MLPFTTSDQALNTTMHLKIIYLSYVALFACLLLSSDFFLAYHIFIYVTAPLSLLPIKIEETHCWGSFVFPRFCLSWSNPIQTISSFNSWVFMWTMMYGVTLVIVSTFTPNFSIEWLCALGGYLLAIALFILITARLALNIDDFYGAFFTVFLCIVSTNAIINIYNYVVSLPSLMDFINIRFSPNFGRVPDHYPTAGAMTYATAYVAAGGLFIYENCTIRKSIAFLSALILFSAICLSQSRGPLLGSTIVVAVIFYICFVGSKRYTFIAVPLFSLFLFLLIPKVGFYAIERGDSHRLEVWERFLYLAFQRPFFGYGERLEIQLELMDGEILGHAHNIFLSALMRSGLLGAITLIFIYMSSTQVTYKFCKLFKNPIPFGLILVAMLAGLVDFDQIVFLADWQWISFWFPLGLAVAAEMQSQICRT